MDQGSTHSLAGKDMLQQEQLSIKVERFSKVPQRSCLSV